MKFALLFLHRGSVHASANGSAHGKIFKTKSVSKLSAFSNSFFEVNVNIN